MLVPMSLGVELVSLTVDVKPGDLRTQQRFRWAIAGADLVDLALAGEITLSGLHLVRPVASPADGPPAAEAGEMITVGTWIVEHGTTERVDELFGALGQDGAIRQVAVAERFRAALRGGAQASPRDEAFVLLAEAAGLTEVHFRGLAKRRAHKQIALLLDEPPPTAEPDRTVRVIARRTLIAVTRSLADHPRRPGIDTWSNSHNDTQWAIGAGFDTGPTV